MKGHQYRRDRRFEGIRGIIVSRNTDASHDSFGFKDQRLPLIYKSLGELGMIAIKGTSPSILGSTKWRKLPTSEECNTTNWYSPNMSASSHVCCSKLMQCCKPKQTQSPHTVEALPRTDSNRSPVSPAPSSPACSFHSELSFWIIQVLESELKIHPIYWAFCFFNICTLLRCPTPTQTKQNSESPVKVKKMQNL